VVLPEGAVPDLRGLAPSRVETTFSYLDFEGRPTLVFELGPTFSKEKERKVALEYGFNRWVWAEWLYCVLAVTGLFVGGVIVNQISL
jgi:hypothetical protein